MCVCLLFFTCYFSFWILKTGEIKCEIQPQGSSQAGWTTICCGCCLHTIVFIFSSLFRVLYQLCWPCLELLSLDIVASFLPWGWSRAPSAIHQMDGIISWKTLLEGKKHQCKSLEETVYQNNSQSDSLGVFCKMA